MKTIFLIISSLFVCIATCTSQVHPNERQIRGYQEVTSLYPPELIAEFPKKLDEKMSVNLGFVSPYGKYFSYIHLVVLLDEDEIKLLKADLETKAKGIYHFSDSCLMPIPYDYNEFKIVKSDSLEICKKKQSMPTTNFKRWGMGFPPNFYKDITMYVLDTKKGKFLKEDFLPESGVGLPKEWLHGYTKGIGIFENYAVYWLEVW